MDIDSLYMAVSASNLADVVKPEFRKVFHQERDKWFPGEACIKHMSDFQQAGLSNIPWDSTRCTDCTARVQYDKRTPGLFKTENTGVGFIGLCSKTYFCFGERDRSVQKA